jgi:hypothetical protein
MERYSRGIIAALFLVISLVLIRDAIATLSTHAQVASDRAGMEAVPCRKSVFVGFAKPAHSKVRPLRALSLSRSELPQRLLRLH